MSEQVTPPPTRQFTDAEKRLLERLQAATESPYPLLDGPAERAAAEKALREELKAGCRESCPPTLPALAHSELGRLADEAGKPTEIVHLQLVASCSGCGRRITRDYAAKP